jgi:hypothetical protein
MLGAPEEFNTSEIYTKRMKLRKAEMAAVAELRQ